jgi:superfamily II DNA/RNA helicase
LDRKKSVDELQNTLKKGGYNCSSIHGDKTQFERNSVLEKFKLGKVPILLATDVIGRGIDFPNVSYIFNYDTPKNIDDYVHRIGRTGRCGNKGKAISFLNESSKPIISDLYKLLKKQVQPVPEFLEQMYYELKGYSYNYAKYKPNTALQQGGNFNIPVVNNNSSYPSAQNNNSQVDDTIKSTSLSNSNETYKISNEKMSWRK